MSGSRARNSSPPRRPSSSSARRRSRIALVISTSAQSPASWPYSSLMPLKRSMSIIATDSCAAVAAGAADQPLEPGEHVAAVEEPGQRVLVEQRLEPAALADELLLQRLGAGGRAHAREHLGGRHRLDQQVGGAAAEQLLRLRERHLLRGDEHHRGGEHLRMRLELVEQQAAARRLDALAHERDVGLVPLAGDAAPARSPRPPPRRSRSPAAAWPDHVARRGPCARRRRSLSCPCPLLQHPTVIQTDVRLRLTRLNRRSRAPPARRGASAPPTSRPYRSDALLGAGRGTRAAARGRTDRPRNPAGMPRRARRGR